MFYIPENEKEMAISYIESFGKNGKPLTTEANFDTIFREYYCAKSKFLYPFFGGNLRLSKYVELEEGLDTFRSKIYDFLDCDGYQFMNLIKKVVKHEYNEYTMTSLELDNIDFVVALLYPWCAETAGLKNEAIECYKNNRLSRNIKILTSNTTIQKNTKLTKFFQTILATAFELNAGAILGKDSTLWLENNYDNFCTAYSKCRNVTLTKGNLVLSIHPLDYMTMSDNDYNWTSCMSWIEDGCYHSGTIEMMNSRNTIVAYLENEDNKMTMPNGDTWSNKKWRELFIIDKHGAVGIKPYPTYNSALEEEILNWIKELYAANGYNKSSTLKRSHSFGDNYYTNGFMYNDFGTRDDNGHPYIEVEETIDLPYLNYCYGGEVTCLACGDFIGWSDAEDLACDANISIETVTYCGEHSDLYNICSHCGERKVTATLVDGKDYCCSCEEKLFIFDELYENTVYCPEGERIYSVRVRPEDGYPLVNKHKVYWFESYPTYNICYATQKKYFPSDIELLANPKIAKVIRENDRITIELNHTEYLTNEDYDADKFYDETYTLPSFIKDLYLKNIKNNNII